MIKRIWDFYLSPKMGWIIYASFLMLFFPAGAAQAVASVFWALCMELTMIRSVLLLFMKEKRSVSRWWRGFGVGILAWICFVLLWIVFGNGVWRLWAYPITVWKDLDRMMFVR